jgi:hypothetical protein
MNQLTPHVRALTIISLSVIFIVVRIALPAPLSLPKLSASYLLCLLCTSLILTELGQPRVHQSSNNVAVARPKMAPTLKEVLNSINLASRDTSTYTELPQAPPAHSPRDTSRNDGWSPSAIIGIVAAIIAILVLVPLIAIILRRYERKRCQEMLPDGVSSGSRSSKSSVREDQSLKSILVTREVQRSSLRMAPSLTRPEEAHTHGRGWSRTEVRGGDW